MFCPNCNHELSDSLEACPECGYPYRANEVLYNRAIKMMSQCTTANGFRGIAVLLNDIPFHRDAKEKAEECLKRAAQLESDEESTNGSIIIVPENAPQRETVATVHSSSKRMKTILPIVAAFLAIVVLGAVFISNHMNEYEKLALQDCEKLQSMLKNPDSLTLYNILVYKDDEQFGPQVYISYGATNSYGAMVRSMAVFMYGTQYAGQYGDSLSDFSSQRAYDTFLMGCLPYKLAEVADAAGAADAFEDFIRIDTKKIMRKLK